MIQKNELEKLIGQLFYQKVALFSITVLFTGLFLFSYLQFIKPSDTIEAKRIDIIEEDGSLAISLSNSDLVRVPQIDNKPIEFVDKRNSPAIIFYDGKGDEVGGFLFSNITEGEMYSATRHLSFDGYKQDQTLTLRHLEQNGRNLAGLHIQDRPKVSMLEAIKMSNVRLTDSSEIAQKELLALHQADKDEYNRLWDAPTRMFVGKNLSGSSVLNLHDAKGIPRLQLEVSAEGRASLNFFNDKGEKIDSLVANYNN